MEEEIDRLQRDVQDYRTQVVANRDRTTNGIAEEEYQKAIRVC